MSELKNDSNIAENASAQEKDYKVIIASDDTDSDGDVVLLTAESVKAQSEQWMYEALQRFDRGGEQYSAQLTEGSYGNTSSSVTLDTLKNLALNAQNDLSKIQQINALIRQAYNEDDILGAVNQAIEANLNPNVRYSFNDLPEDYDPEILEQVDGIIKRFHREVNINDAMTTAITSTYNEGTCIMYLRSKKYKGIYHYVIDKYPLGVAIVSDYSENGIPRILIDMNELKSRLQKTMLKNKKNKPLFFSTTADEIKSNYPKEVIDAYNSKEKYAVLDLRRTGTNRFGNLGRKYGVSPVFKALKPKIMLDTFDKADNTNAKAKAKKIIAQMLRKETMGTTYEKKGLEDMAYAHAQLMQAWKNSTVVYTPPPCVEDIKYVEPEVEMTNTSTITQYRSRVTSALGISFLNTDGQQTVSTANISLKQLMKTINKIAQRQEIILQRWYEILLEEHDIPMEYCPTPTVLDAEQVELDIRMDLAEFLYSKLNASYQTVYSCVGYDFRNELERRKKEKESGVDEIFTPHPTSYNSSGDEVTSITESDSEDGGRPVGSTSNGNEVNETKQEYDSNRNSNL